MRGGSENTKFIYDGMDVVADDNGGTLTKYQNGLGNDDKLKVSINGTAKYFITDHLGSTVGLTNQSGAIAEQTSYDSFGNSANNLSTRYQFTGREYDSFTELQYSRARWYDSKTGRFISEDPIGFRGGDVNLFGYVKSNPIYFTDSQGTVALPFLWLYSPSKKPECTGSCQRDLSKINDIFDSTVNNMNESGERHWFYPWNGIQGTLTIFTGDKAYLSCVDQAEKLKKQLDAAKENNEFENGWNFDKAQRPLPPHTWIIGQSSDPNSPELTLDPWKNIRSDSGISNLPLL